MRERGWTRKITGDRMTRFRSESSVLYMIIPSAVRCSIISCTSSSSETSGVLPIPLSAASWTVSWSDMADLPHFLKVSSTSNHVKGTLHLMYSSSSTHSSTILIAATITGSLSPAELSTGKNHRTCLLSPTVSLYCCTLEKAWLRLNSSYNRSLIALCSSALGTLSLCVPISKMGAVPTLPSSIAEDDAHTLLIQKRRLRRHAALSAGSAVEQRRDMSKQMV
mmetsp:Transcript_28114/g.68842  ORF Transcript_28114/g.68842 Transcript_28114/m.68842 type:complete len:222 (-) Transcript_28114:64-729(-)